MQLLLDIATLRLCSVIAASAFAAVFLLLWAAHPGERHWPCWAASLGGYATVLVGFAAATDHRVIAVLFAALGMTSTLVLVGVRQLEEPRDPAWLWALGLAPGVGYALPLLALGLHPDEAAAWPCRFAASLGLAANTAAIGSILLFGRQAVPGWGGRIAGAALLGYLPAYAVDMAVEVMQRGSLGIAILLPMLADQLLLGVMNLGLLAMLSERAQARLRALAELDPLTGALNRAGLATRMPAAPPAGTAVILIDVDHFKALNDHHGHAAGDAVLAALVAAVRVRLPSPRDLVVRLGGDEFAVVLRDTTLPEALALAERIRTARPEAGLPFWTMSLGVAMSLPEERTLAETMARADRTLYHAKQTGRDRAA